MKKLVARIGGAAALVGASGWAVVGNAPAASADTPAYELYCPGTPVGTIALNDVVTSGTITAGSGGQFNITNYQTKVNLPQQIVSAAAALGNSSITGSAQTTIHASGATPASIQSPPLQINSPIPSPVPSSGLELQLPNPAGSVGPFTSSGGQVTITQDSSASLTLVVSGNNLSLTCTAYQNNSVPTGITTQKPSGAALSPTIASGSPAGGGGGTPTTTAAPTATTAPATSPSNLAYTGAGPGLYLLGALGLAGLGLAGLLLLGTRLRAGLVEAVARGRRR